ncbi:MAG: iron transporter [Haloquadratum sp.]
MKRRAFLKHGAGLAGGVSLSGCLDRLGFETQSAWRDPPLVRDRPDGVYYPAVVEGMGTYGTTTVDDVGFALLYSFPHRFWNLTGTRKTKVVVRERDSLHLMATVWDAKTKTVLPVDVSVTIGGSDGRVTTTNLWPMLSPNMGFHYGDNVALPGEGHYEATLRIGPLQTGRTRPFEGRFTESRSATIGFTFDTAETYDLAYRRLGEKAGTRGTVDLMEMEGVPEPVAPPKRDLPGRLLGEGTADDATFFVSAAPADSRFGDGDRPALVVSPRTPYNRIVLPRMTLSATIERDGETVFRGPLRASLDPEVGCFYGAAIPGIEAGDTVTIEPQTPPQLARHGGYETAFIQMSPIGVSA